MWTLARPRLRQAGVVATLVLSALLTLTAWAISSPPGSSADEGFHMTSIWCPAAIDACDRQVYEDHSWSILVPKDVVYASTCLRGNVYESGACVQEMSSDLIRAMRPVRNDGLYPDGFYRTMGLFTGDDTTRSVFAMRIVNSVAAISLFGAAAAMLSRPNRRVLIYGGLVVSIPQAIYLIASINPSGWSVTGVAVAFIGLHGWFTETFDASGSQQVQRWRDLNGRQIGLAVLSLVGATMAASSRGDAGMFVVLAAGVLLVLHSEQVREWWWFALPALVASAIGMISFFTSGQGTAALGSMDERPPGDFHHLFANLFDFPGFLMNAQVGPLGWNDLSVPAISAIPPLVFATAVAFTGLRVITWRKTLALSGLIAASVAIPLIVFQRSGWHPGELAGRYWTPLLAVIVMTALWNPVRRSAPKLKVPQSVAVWLSLSIGNAAMLYRQIRRYTTGLGYRGISLNEFVEWWPARVSPNATFLLGSLGFSTLVGLAFWLAGRPDSPDLATDGTATALAVHPPERRLRAGAK